MTSAKSGEFHGHDRYGLAYTVGDTVAVFPHNERVVIGVISRMTAHTLWVYDILQRVGLSEEYCRYTKYSNRVIKLDSSQFNFEPDEEKIPVPVPVPPSSDGSKTWTDTRGTTYPIILPNDNTTWADAVKADTASGLNMENLMRIMGELDKLVN